MSKRVLFFAFTLLSAVLLHGKECACQGFNRYWIDFTEEKKTNEPRPLSVQKFSHNPLYLAEHSNPFLLANYRYHNLLNSEQSDDQFLVEESVKELLFTSPLTFSYLSGIGIAYREFNFTGSIKLPQDEIIFSKYVSTASDFIFLFNLNFLNRVLSGASLQVQHTKNGNGFYYTLPLQINLPFNLKVLFVEKLSAAPQGVMLQTEDLFVKTPLDFDIRSQKIKVSTTLRNCVFPFYEYEVLDIVESQTKSFLSNYDFIPMGSLTSRKYGINLSWHKTWLFFGYVSKSLFSQADLYFDDVQYGKLIRFNLKMTSFDAQVTQPFGDNHFIGMGIQHTNYTLEGKVRIETWPFTETIIDLLGIRQIGNANARLTIDRYSAHYNYTGKVGFGVKTEFYNLYPMAISQTWRPAFLVFGVTDLKNHELSYRRLTAMQVTFQTSFRFLSSIRVRYQLSQVIPLSVKEKNETKEPEQPAQEKPASTTNKTSGGTFHLLQFVCDFN